VEPERTRDILQAERDRLEALLGMVSLTDAGRESQSASISELSSQDQHPADLGSETFERAKELSIRTNLQGRLRDIERAFERLKRGTYGICEACGRPIADARLEAMPAARFCVADQAAAERELSA